MCVGQTHIPPLFDSGNFTNMIRTGKKNCVRTGCLIVYIHMNKFTTFTTSSVLFCVCFVIDIYIYIYVYIGEHVMIGLGALAQWLLCVLRHSDCFGCSGTMIASCAPAQRLLWLNGQSVDRLVRQQDWSTPKSKLVALCVECTCSLIWNETVKTYERPKTWFLAGTGCCCALNTHVPGMRLLH